MKRIFITYGDSGYEAAKIKLCDEALETSEFDDVIAYGRDNLSKELMDSDVINIKRGGGLWSWKPDIIYKTMLTASDGDLIVYCDAGCTVSSCNEWSKYWMKLEKADIIAQRIIMRTDKWTRKEILDYFNSTGKWWQKNYQYLATTILISVSDFSRLFISEWRDIVINHPNLICDVKKEEMVFQHPTFVENRHDQSVYSALIYKYLNNETTHDKIYAQWEHIEDFDPFFRQAIRATRARTGNTESSSKHIKRMMKRIIKDFILKPFYFIPMENVYSILNRL